MIKSYKNQAVTSYSKEAQLFGKDCARHVIKYHQSFPNYQKTPLKKLTHLATFLGVSKIYVKDESKRFGLNAFKGLGGSYCIGIKKKIWSESTQKKHWRV